MAQNSLRKHSIILSCSGSGSLEIEKVDFVSASLILAAPGAQRWQLFLN